MSVTAVKLYNMQIQEQNLIKVLQMWIIVEGGSQPVKVQLCESYGSKRVNKYRHI